MTRTDLIAEVHQAARKESGKRKPRKESVITREEAAVTVDAIFDNVVRTVCSGGKVEIRGFGSFGTRQLPPRQIRNPKDRARIADVPAKQIPYFEASKTLKNLVNDSTDRVHQRDSNPRSSLPRNS